MRIFVCLALLLNAALSAVSAAENLNPLAQASDAEQRYGPYTRDAFFGMSYCIGLSDTVTQIAIKKLNKVPLEEVKAFYTAKANEKLNIEFADTVYADTFTSPSEYTLAFFRKCAIDLAEVPIARVTEAKYCANSTLIADLAHAYKISGASKQAAYAQIAPKNQAMPRMIVDRIYASRKDRARDKLDTWVWCVTEHAPEKQN